MKNSPLAHVELSKNNLIHNIKVLRGVAKKGTKFSIAIKGNAYGHGQNEVAKILNKFVDYFQVDSVEELELLRKVSKKETFVFGYIQKTDLKRAIKLGCIMSIFSLEQLKEINKVALRLSSGRGEKFIQEVHLPIDAYLGREGFLLASLPEVLKEIKKCKYIKLTGIYAHFANIEDTRDFSHARKQIDQYQKAIILAYEYGFNNLQTHISATSGLLVYEGGQGINMLIRLGIGAYGLWPSKDLKSLDKNTIELKPVLSWKTKIAQIKILEKGSTIGYGLTYKTNKRTKTALIPQGYADGFDRGFSNNGYVLIGGTKCKILGRVMMNMFVVDINHLKNAKIEDEVVILGRQEKLEITAEDMAQKINTINYEITTRVNPLLSRVII